MTMGMERARSGLARACGSRSAAAGRSAHPDAAVAGHEAVAAALDACTDPGLVLLFVAGDRDLDAVLTAADAVAGRVPVVGSTTATEIDADGLHAGTVVALALGGDGMSFSTAAVEGAPPRDAGARAAACLGDVADREHRVLLLLADAGMADHADIVRGAYSVTGAGVPLVGGVAAHPVHGLAGGPAVLHERDVLRGAVVGVAIGSDAPLGVGARHGWEPAGAPMLVTSAVPGRILTLDDRPAAEVYRECLGLDEPTDADALAHPLGLQRRVGEAAARSVVYDRAPDGSIACAAPAGALVWLMSTRADDVLASASLSAQEAIIAAGGSAPTAMLVFGCGARAKVLGDRAPEEVARVLHWAGGAAVGGFTTFGEFARTRGIAGAHHQTHVVLAVA
jgi:hypothetical protein